MLMSMDDRVGHWPGDRHGVALCGEVMRDPWKAGPTVAMSDEWTEVCVDCWELSGEGTSG